MVAIVKEHNHTTTYTSVDLNATGTTTVLNPTNRQHTVYGVYLDHGGSTGEVNLEATDGTDTAILAQPGAGGSVEFGDTIAIPAGETVQINVTTAEGSALSETCVVFSGEQGKPPSG